MAFHSLRLLTSAATSREACVRFLPLPSSALESMSQAATLNSMAPFVRWCGELRLPANYSRPEHFIYDHLFVYVLGGHADYRVGDRNWQLGPGDLLLVPPGAPTTVRTGDHHPMWYRFIRFDFDFAGDYERRPMNSREPGARRHAVRNTTLPAGLRLPRKLQIGHDLRVPLLFDRAISEMERKEPGYELMVRTALMELIALVHRKSCRGTAKPATPSSKPEPVRRALAFIEAHAAENLSLAAIAGAAHLSPQHFSRVFHRATGFSPGRYLLLTRLRIAKAALEAPDATVKQAAFAAGFEDQHYFARLFHKVEGLTPSAYRRAILSLDGGSSLRLTRLNGSQARGPFFTIPPAKR